MQQLQVSPLSMVEELSYLWWLTRNSSVRLNKTGQGIILESGDLYYETFEGMVIAFIFASYDMTQLKTVPTTIRRKFNNYVLSQLELAKQEAVDCGMEVE